MIILKHRDNIITNIYSCNQENISSLKLNENEYLVFEFSDAYTGLDIRALNPEGTLKTVQERFDLGLITLAEDEIFENGEIKKRPEDIKNNSNKKEPQNKTVTEVISEKNQELDTIKDQYLIADLLEDKELQIQLKTQYIELKNELEILKNNNTSPKV